MAGTDLTYNGVTIRNCMTRSFETVTVPEESGTDKLYEQTTITVEGYLHLDETASLRISGIDIPDDNIASAWVPLGRLLMSFRHSLTYKIDDITLLECGVGEDASGGPKPQSLKIIKVIGAKCLQVSYTIVVVKTGCEQDGDRTAPRVISNRWDAEESFDTTHICTRTVSGTLKISRPSTDAQPVNFTGIVIPGLARGYRRDKISVQQGRDQVTLRYTIVDVQAHDAPPSPAVAWDCTHTGETSDGATFRARCRVRLVGRPTVRRTDLFIRCAQILENRLGRFRDMASKNTIESLSFTDHLSEPVVEAEAIIRYGPARTAISWFQKLIGKNLTAEGADLVSFGGVIGNDSEIRFPAVEGYDPGIWPAPPTGNLGLASSFSMFLQYPCSDSHSMPGGGNAAPSPGYATPAEVTVTEEPPDTPSPGSYDSPGDKSKYSDQHGEAMYTTYTLDSEWDIQNNLLHIAFASASEDSEDDAGFFPIGRKLCRRIVRIVAERVGKWPEIPEPKDLSPDIRLLRHRIMPSAPRTAPAANTLVYRVEGEYTFGYRKTPDEFDAGNLPYVSVEDAEGGIFTLKIAEPTTRIL